ncbi:MAG: aldo/keto reductase [Rhizobiaceae bacterium]
MKYRKLGRTDMEVSEICLGTMTLGTQNSEAEGHAQIDMAVEAGVNFIDTAEIYPTTPMKKETCGRTEEILGSWLANSGKRGDVIVATKVPGQGSLVLGDQRVDGKILSSALEASLKRLRTDYIDLYQLHWPNRGSYHFRRCWNYDPTTQDVGDLDGEIDDMLGEVQKLVGEGKIRAFGLSNETAWGTTRWLKAAEEADLPRVASMQNEYSLLCRYYDLDMAEVSIREDIGLLAYSPLAAGLLSGKYVDGDVPAGTRMSMQAGLNGRNNEISRQAVKAYSDLARENGISFDQMSLAFCLGRPFMTSVIIGATTMEQLESNLGSVDLELSEAVLDGIAEIYKQYPVPM